MGRKRNQGKARRAAKAKVREEADVRGGNNPTTANPSAQSLSVPRRQLQIGEEKCTHGYDRHTISTELMRFVNAFNSSFHEAIRRGGSSLSQCLIDVRKATWTKFTDVWEDLAKMEVAMSCFLCAGTDSILVGQNHVAARKYATIVRFFGQHIAVKVKQTQALFNCPKIDETHHADDHTLVKFLRHRIPCSCLDEKYEEVKRITKVGYCYNSRCKFTSGKVERSQTKCCSRCRCATYCSRECQVADWLRHKPVCDNNAVIIARFEAKQKD